MRSWSLGYRGMQLVGPPYGFIADSLLDGTAVPFFGAGASAVYRPQNEAWEAGRPFMPFGGELAMMLASAANYPAVEEAYERALSDLTRAMQGMAEGITVGQAESVLAPVLQKHLGGPPDLAFVASWAEHVQGHRRAVHRKLRQSFAVECSPGLLHNEIAGIEATRLYVTTNYDDMLEKALAPRQPHTIVDRGEQGLWVSVAGQTPLRVSSTGTELYDLLNDPKTQQPSRPILFKMHGSVDKANALNDHYLITEEDYVDFLGRASKGYIPPYVDALMLNKDFLFLGYSLEDWHVRVILRKLLAGPRNVRFWAIVTGHSEVEQRVWQANELSIYPVDLIAFAEELARHL
jgi:hypothetical protein